MNIVCFYIFGIALFSPVFIFKSVFHRVTLIIMSYPIWILSGLYLGFKPIRIVAELGFYFYESYIDSAFYTAIFGYFIFLFIIKDLKKEQVYLSSLSVSYDFQYILLPLFIISACVAYPRAFFVGDNRFGALGGLFLIMYALIFLIKNNRICFFYYISYFICIFLFTRGERVDILLMLLLPFIYPTSRLYKLIPLLIFVFILGTYSGISRLGISISIEELCTLLTSSITNYGTAVDVVHVYLSSVGYFYDVGSSFKPFLNIVSSFVPGTELSGASSTYNIAIFLRDYIDNLGGGLFYSSGFIAFGSLGAISFFVLYGYLYRYLCKYSPGFIFLVFWLMQFRIQWYGMTYYSMPLLVSVFIFLMIKQLSKNSRILK